MSYHNKPFGLETAPNERDLRWFKYIERHGPLNSRQLIAWTADTHRCEDTAKRRLQALRSAQFLFRPEQSRRTERAEFKPYVYDLAPLGRLLLRESGLAEDAIRPTGHWWHLHATATLTAKIDLAARAQGYRFIAGHRILERHGATLAIPVGRQKLIPDQLFAIDYGGLFRAFMVEVDRGTEPIASASSRKSWTSSLKQYGKVFEAQMANRHYRLKAPIQVVWQLSTKARLAAFERLISTKFVTQQDRHLRFVDELPASLLNAFR